MFGLSSLPRNLNAATRDAKHRRVEVRVAAVRDLARLAHDAERAAAISALVAVLDSDSEPSVRAQAAVCLSDAQAHEAISDLLRAARAGHVKVREMAVLALGETAPSEHAELRALLEETLNDPAPELRFQSLIAARRLVPSLFAERLAEATRDEDMEVRQIAFRLAEEAVDGGEFELPEPVRQRACAALRDDSSAVRLAAALLLTRVRDSAGHAVIAAVVKRELRVPSLADEQAAVELAGELGLEETRAALSRRAFGILGFTRDRLFWHARVSLARLGDSRARDALLRGLRAYTRDARTVAVAAVGRARLVEARPLLRAMSTAHADPDTVAEALAALGPE
ncbi:MAG TPA: HEAT repeat domain-containing protein [Polyangiaceae bacterium]|jgi:HEAT repeat protein